MTSPAPQYFVWTGKAMEPVHPARAERAFTLGETYRLGTADDRTAAEHRFFFAAVADAHRNLPEAMADQFPTPDALRKYALIKCGYYEIDTLVCPDDRTATMAATFARHVEDFVIITIEGNVVTRFTAKSQSYRSMSKAEFRKSKEDVLDFLVALLSTTRHALEHNTKTAA